MHLLKKEDINRLLLSLKVLFLPTCTGSILFYIYVKRINRRKQKDVLPQQLSDRLISQRRNSIQVNCECSIEKATWLQNKIRSYVY